MIGFTGGHLIVGPGALGRMLAHALAPTQGVTLISQRALPAQQTLTTPEGETVTRRLPVIRLAALAPIGSPALIHLTTKAYAAEAVAVDLAEKVAPGTALVLWQNGFGVQPSLTRRWPGPVLCASTTEGAYVVDDAAIVHAGHGESVIGDLHGRHLALAHSLAATLTRAGLKAAAVDDIGVRLWQKLAVNAAINPLVALYEVPNGALREARFDAELTAVIEEIAAILAAEGIAPPSGSGAAGWRRLVDKVIEATADNRASMLQDVDARRPTERGAILAPLIERAEHNRLPCPTLAALDARLAEKEAAFRLEG
ncbi:ketopantoate reductase family protein [Vreelandella subglaciescola]|uniref:2-dehydropantoate 2-reductase n=1 Tax=Vreelandella subglaciescola TaxID=29571 RepID=A0A1M7EY12_9GAMM|nr:2-dehydropantoate 2-reductase [Halomonas subglaciescola]SHL96566.1 ketopantoate reductase [Halomonas subglaciescola]